LASFFARLFKMTNFAVKHSIMTPEMVENFCNDYYIPDEVHPVAPGRDKTITQFPEGKVGVYTRFFDYCGYRIPFTKFLMAVLRYFRIHISQLSPFGAARVSHFEVLTRVLDLAPSVTVFRAFYTRTYSDGLFSFAKRSPSSPSCFPKPPDSIKNWSDHFFWVDAKVFPIPVSLYVGGALEKDPAPHLTARQEQTVRLLENNKAPFRRYPECFLCLVGLSPYYPFDENTYPAFERPDGTDMGLLDFIKTADPRKVQAVEVQKKDDQVKLLESTSHCFMPLVTPAAGGSSSAAAPEVSAPAEVEPENVVPEDTYLDLTGPDEVVATQSGKSKRKRLGKQSDTLPAKQLRKDHPSFATGTGGKTLAGLRQLMPTSPLVSRPSFQADIQAHVVQSARITDVPVYTAAATVTSARENVGITPTVDVVGSSAEHELDLNEKTKRQARRGERGRRPGVVRLRVRMFALPGGVIAEKSLLLQKNTEIFPYLISLSTYLKDKAISLRFLPFTPPFRTLKRRRKLSRKSRPRDSSFLSLKCLKYPENQGIASGSGQPWAVAVILVFRRAWKAGYLDNGDSTLDDVASSGGEEACCTLRHPDEGDMFLTPLSSQTCCGVKTSTSVLICCGLLTLFSSRNLIKRDTDEDPP
ncbi:hypothetical protein Tco_1108426, partial [Tanacetum coccineum]